MAGSLPRNKISRRHAVKRAVGAAAGAAATWYLVEPTRFFVRSSRKPVTFWHQLGGIWLEPMNSIVEAFNRSQDRYELNPLLMSDSEADSKMLLSSVGGAPPDVVLTWTQATSEWADSGLLQPLDPFMSPTEMQWLRQSTYPVIRKSGWFKGRLYGIVMGFDLWVCYYRPDHFRAAGLDPDHFPETLEDLVTVGSKLLQVDAGGKVTRLGFMPYGFQTFAPLFGGGFYDEKSGELTLRTPQNLKTLEFLADCRKAIGFDKVEKFEAGLGSDDGVSWAFIQGKHSIIAEGEWRVEQLRKNAPQIEYRTAPTPPPRGGKPRASFSMTNFLIMPKAAREPLGAWEFIKFWAGLANPMAAADYYWKLGWMPLGPEVTKAPVYDAWLKQVPQYRTFLQVAESDNIRITPPVPFELFLMDQVKKTDDGVCRGTVTPEIGLQQLEEAVARERLRRKRLGYAE